MAVAAVLVGRGLVEGGGAGSEIPDPMDLDRRELLELLAVPELVVDLMRRDIVEFCNLGTQVDFR